jgi:hypothetical protein
VQLGQSGEIRVELFGMVLSLPAAFIASLVYCFILTFSNRTGPLARAMFGVSMGVLLAWVVEIALLATIGSVRSRAVFGPAFYAAHSALFVLGTPALANLLVLWPPKGLVRWFWAVPICTVFGVTLVVLQYGVSEALYGVEGTGGPFS